MDDNSTRYDCKLNNVTLLRSCLEPDDIFNATVEYSYEGDVWDGACCENTNNNESVCCFVSLAEVMNTANYLK